MTCKIRTALSLLLVSLSMLGIGCGRAPKMAEVEGTVTLDGKPLANVEVAFLPDPSQGTKGPRSTAITDASGRFRLVADNRIVGVVRGKHRVILTDLHSVPPVPRGSLDSAPAAAGDQQQIKNTPGNALPSRVPGIYSSSSQTPLSREVRSGSQAIDFQLTSRL